MTAAARDNDVMVAAAKSAALLDIVSARVALKRDGKEYKGCCPFHADATPSFYVVPVKGFFHCFGCGAHGDGVKFIMDYEQVDFLEACRRIAGGTAPVRRAPPAATPEQDARERHEKVQSAIAIWRDTREADGTVVEAYLRARGITLPPPVCLRYHPALPHKPSGHVGPAMVAAVQNAAGGICAIHRTWLRADGSGKADVNPNKMGLGSWNGGHIRLSRYADRLAVAEGIETAMSVMQSGFGLPCWATMSLGNIGAAVPEAVREVIICADSDGAEKDHTKHEAILIKAASQFQDAGKRVRIARPPAGMDFNDWLRAGG